MKIIDFLRKFRQDKKQKESKKEKIPFSELENWIEHNIKKTEEQEEDIFLLIEKKIEIFSEKIKEKIKAIENFNLDTKKVEDRIKSLAEDGRKKYIEAIEYLLNNLKNLKKDRLEKTISEIDKLLSNFNKKSHSSYERATILIGKEMGSIKETLKNFSNEVIKIFDQNKNIIDFSKKLFLVKSKLKQFGEKDEEIKKFGEKIDFVTNEIKNKEKEKEEATEKIEKIKKSREYLEVYEKKEKLKIFKDELEKDIFALRQDIDFKALGNFYHIFKEEMKILKSYKNSFLKEFQKDDGKTILELIEITKLPKRDIPQKINEIKDKKKEILDFELKIKKEKSPEKLKEISFKITEILEKKKNLENIKMKEEKKLNDLKKEKNLILNEIKENAMKMNLEF